MKVLWFSHVSLIQNKDDKFFYPGGNWISSLKTLIENDHNIILGIFSWGDEEIIFEDNNGTKYYQFKKKQTSKFKNYYKNWRHEIESEHQMEKLLYAVQDFQPNVIHIFGTESIFGNIAKYTTIPVVIHLQGLINPCLNAWKFPGFKIISLLKSSNWIYFIKGVGLFHDYFRFKNMAQRELEIYKSCNNFMGRTHWDKAVTKLYSPAANYYHCDEVIRDCFYQQKWKITPREKFILSSTINENIFKGLDLILKSAILLKRNTTVNFEWNIYGINSNSEYARFVEKIVGEYFYTNHVVLKGTVTSEHLLDGLLHSNLFVHCSYIDNSPNSICEAQLIGLPVISTNTGGISSLIHDEIDGFLVPSNEPHILASKIIDLVNDTDKLLKISKNSFEIAHKRHNKDKIKKNIFEIYSTIINNV